MTSTGWWRSFGAFRGKGLTISTVVSEQGWGRTRKTPGWGEESWQLSWEVVGSVNMSLLWATYSYL